MNAKKEAQTIQGTKQEFLKIFREMCYARNAWQVWEDLISAIACSLANSTDPDKTNVQYKEREREYAQCIKRLGGVDKPAKCFAIMVEALERDPEQDFLGELYMELNLRNHWKGQFFTPYHICDFMAKITEGNIDGEIEKKGFISIFDTIYEILGLTKVNTRILQAVDGNHDILRLLQVAQQIGLQFKPEQLKEYYETFGCNTDLLKQANRKTTLHKIVKYITKESENYPIGEQGACLGYSYMRYKEREDPRIERKQNMAKDWLEYLKWCKELGYDLNNMFFYMPLNFRKVHDRTAKEYQKFLDKKAVAEKKRREREAKKRMAETKKALEEILGENGNIQNAFQIKGKGLLLVVPASAEDIKAEGAALHHCVGTYVDRVARGETNIFFIRKEKEPDKPYFTMEWRDNDIVQCRGSRNCGMTPEVKAFTEAFKKKMLETIEKDKDKGLRRCG